MCDNYFDRQTQHFGPYKSAHLRGRLLGLPVHLLSSKGLGFRVSPLLRGSLRGLMSLKRTSPLSAVPKSKLSRSAASAAGDGGPQGCQAGGQKLCCGQRLPSDICSAGATGPAAAQDQKQGAAGLCGCQINAQQLHQYVMGVRKYQMGCRICSSAFHELGYAIYCSSLQCPGRRVGYISGGVVTGKPRTDGRLYPWWNAQHEALGAPKACPQHTAAQPALCAQPHSSTACALALLHSSTAGALVSTQR